MSGWFIKITSPGLEPDNRKIVEIYVAWISNADAIAAVEHTAGIGGPTAETLCGLSDDSLKSIGLTKEGQIARVRCILTAPNAPAT
jgi:hypothetical protein